MVTCLATPETAAIEPVGELPIDRLNHGAKMEERPTATVAVHDLPANTLDVRVYSAQQERVSCVLGVAWPASLRFKPDLAEKRSAACNEFTVTEGS